MKLCYYHQRRDERADEVINWLTVWQEKVRAALALYTFNYRMVMQQQEPHVIVMAIIIV